MTGACAAGSTNGQPLYEPPTETNSAVAAPTVVPVEPTVAGTPLVAPADAGTTTTAAPAAFESSIIGLDATNRHLVELSWREGCPVGLEELRLVEVRHHDFNGGIGNGRLIVHHEVAEALVSVFQELFDVGFPIQRIELVDEYGASDIDSMRANNTSAFNCRRVSGTDRWSEHAFGRAVDINPLVNPYVRGQVVDPPEGAPYADRPPGIVGAIYADDAVVQAFEKIGWQWGGTWSSAQDYQHFSQSGR